MCKEYVREAAESQKESVRQPSLEAFIHAPAQVQRLCQAAPDMHASNTIIKNVKTQTITKTHEQHLCWEATGRALAEDAADVGSALAEDGGRAGVMSSGPLSLGPAGA